MHAWRENKIAQQNHVVLEVEAKHATAAEIVQSLSQKITLTATNTALHDHVLCLQWEQPKAQNLASPSASPKNSSANIFTQVSDKQQDITIQSHSFRN